MITLSVSATSSYHVHIGSGLLDQLGIHLAKVCSPRQVAVITDSNVGTLYLNRAVSSLVSAGYEAVSFTFPAGEASKNLTVFGEILEFLALSSLSRSDAVIALGGGVTGDMAGFAASVYQRGIPFIQVPTSLLSAVDSSVGGKTAVNLSAGKNLAGAFYQPKLVLCDTDTLRTLPATVYAEGMAEVIKYGMISDPELLRILKDSHDIKMDEVIACCVKHKADIVHVDEFDTGMRQLLNFGHTIGHAIERCSDYSVPHGTAVAIGMAVMTRACIKQGLCNADTYESLKQLFTLYHLPYDCPFSAGDLHTAALHDKKHANGKLTIVVPRSFGTCELKKVDDSELLSLIRAGVD